MKMARKLSTISIANSLDDIESCTNSECLTFRDEMIKRLTAMDENLKKNTDKYDSLCTIVMELQLELHPDPVPRTPTPVPERFFQNFPDPNPAPKKMKTPSPDPKKFRGFRGIHP
ncbi:unnamed protein product [Meloidogyne enterolobii]|uniref:Uncharacterized protein n=1 Tax=Meloidogyne enterolobii TaxID=390850 RepID=A0ACB0YWX5_MELEN